MPPILAIVGRANVGKSTLFNRLTGTRHALVHDTPGVTRDWREAPGNIGPMDLMIRDTAGFERAGKESLTARMTEKTMQAIEGARVLLFVLDARGGVTAGDEEIARFLRETNKPVALALNKAEGKVDPAVLAETYRLGLGEPALISAEHGEGMADLYQVIDRALGEREEEVAEEFVPAADPSAPIQIAIVGRPNAGKSTLLNQLLGEERTLTGPEAGITRDAISADFTYKGRALKLVDTAGLRRKSKVQETLEKMSTGDTVRVIKFAQVVIVLLDAELALEKQDLSIVSLIEKEGRAPVMAINKWDKVKEKNEYLEVFHARMVAVLPQVTGVPVVTLSALRGQGVKKVLDAALHAHEIWNKHIPTAALNRWLKTAVEKHAPPLAKGRRIKLRYMTQASTRPPSFVLFTNVKEVPDSYIKYLAHGLREAFDLAGVPIRIKLKQSENPYATE